MSSEKNEKGRQLLDKLCGNPDGVSGLPEQFGNYTLEHLFGDVWQGKELALELEAKGYDWIKQLAD